MQFFRKKKSERESDSQFDVTIEFHLVLNILIDNRFIDCNKNSKHQFTFVSSFNDILCNFLSIYIIYCIIADKRINHRMFYPQKFSIPLIFHIYIWKHSIENVAKDSFLFSHQSTIYHSNDDNKKIHFDKRRKKKYWTKRGYEKK